MFYSIDGNIVKLEGGFPKRKVNSLTFQVSGSKFPEFSFQTTSNGFIFESSIPQSVIVNWGDGNVISYPLLRKNTFDTTYAVGWTQSGNESTYVKDHELQPIHNFQDGNTGSRFITFTFDDLSAIVSFRAYYILLEGSLPVDLLSAKRLTGLNLAANLYLTNLPDLSENKDIVSLNFAQISQTKFDKIPDSFFELNPTTFRATSTFDLSDVISSNLFKINQWTNLEFLSLEDCDISEFDDSFSELTEILDLRINRNNFTEFPPQIANFYNLYRLYINVIGDNISFIDFRGLPSLKYLWLTGNYNLSEIPLKWKGLVSLIQISNTLSFVNTNDKFNEFIGFFYILCISEGYLDVSTPTVQADDYPNKFRDIEWGHSSLTPTGTYQAPTGFVQGSNNGNPTNEAEKIFVLVNNYGHTVTFNQP